jgi:lipooligosaccharide transport system permease protein
VRSAHLLAAVVAVNVAAASRIIPVQLRDARRAHHMVERSMVVYRRGWMMLVSGFFEPLFYLLSIRVGAGKLVGDIEVGGHLVDYATFVAPSLLAASAMNGAVTDSTINVFHKLRYAKTYDAVLATPMTPGDIALGEITWALIRGVIYAAIFTVVMIGMGLADSPWIVAAVPIAVLIGFAFAGVGMAATTYMRGWADFEFIFLATMPMFLFSGSFFPLSRYSPSLRLVVQLTPLYHGVELERAAATGHFRAGSLIDVMYLLALGGAGLVVAARRIERLLRT